MSGLKAQLKSDGIVCNGVVGLHEADEGLAKDGELGDYFEVDGY